MHVRAVPDVTFEAPTDYRNRYTQFAPATTLQNINLSPDFPSVGQVLMSLAPQAGVGAVDGVLAVDPEGLAALLQLTGPVDVVGWPTQITAENVVDVTLRDAYAAFEDTPERADFLGDVAQVAVDAATNGNLGRPAQIAKVLGRAAHEGIWCSRSRARRAAPRRRARGLRADGPGAAPTRSRSRRRTHPRTRSTST